MSTTVPTTIKSCLPRPVRRWLASIRDRAVRWFYLARWRTSRHELPARGVSLTYAGVLSNSNSGVLHGGAVKLLQLHKKFPDRPHSFNILYLVSSALPRFALEYAKEMKRRGAKLVFNQNGVAYPALGYENWESTNRNMRLLLEAADYVVYQSRFCKTCADRFLAETNSPGEVIYNCVDTNEFTPGDRAGTDGALVLLAAGTHQHRGRIMTTLDALHRLLRQGGMRCQLNIAGPLDWPGAAEDVAYRMKQLGLGDEVKMIPSFEHKDAPDIYRNADILLHLKYKDPCPTVVIEAMSCGVPVIGSNSGGMPELLGEHGGILLDVPDSWDTVHYPGVEAVVAAVTAIREDLASWSRRCRAHAVETFDCKKWLKDHERIFRKLAG